MEQVFFCQVSARYRELNAECLVSGQDPGAGTSVTLANESQDAALSIDDVTTSDVMP